MEKRFFTSFSGGKDCSLAHHLAIQAGMKPVALLSTVNLETGRSMSHAIPDHVMSAQARAMGLPLVRAQVTWGSYEAAFHELVSALVKDEQVTHGVFGDIDLEAHRAWEEKVCAPHGVEAVLPLWQIPRREVARMFLSSGFKATIIVVNADKAPEKYVGRAYDAKTVEEMIADGVDPCGESGEFHTLVTDGPTFSAPITLSSDGLVRQDNDVFLNLL